MKNAFIGTMIAVIMLFASTPDCNAGKKCEKSEVQSRKGFGLYLGVTPFYEIGPRYRGQGRTPRFSPHLMLHSYAGPYNSRYHHRGNVILPRSGRGHGIGLGLRYGIFRSRNLGLGIHIR
tara:strand:+ start:1400 stop:1759 length:360 start_codon:yes stop_codon:yes gene_type:complete